MEADGSEQFDKKHNTIHQDQYEPGALTTYDYRRY